MTRPTMILNSVSHMGLILCLIGPAGLAAAGEVRIDAARRVGPIRPLHGLNCGPLCDGGMVDLSEHYRQIAPPLVRLHDCHWPVPDVVDIHVIFPDFQADPSRPESYDFRRTDDYVAAVLATGSQIVFRLGESIEHTPRKYYVHPPADNQRWADICVGIIRHYNEGWADGFHHGIQYWEIWNEPENRPAMWSGTDEDYFRLYRTAAKTIKARFPTLKVGGPAVGYTGHMENGVYHPSEFIEGFLDHCRRDGAPLDFFSWHIYTNDPEAVVARARLMRDQVNKYGFDRTETHLNEWNYLPDDDWGPMGPAGQGEARERWFARMAGAEGAAFTAEVLIRLQDEPVDVSNFYRGEVGGFSVFNTFGTPQKSFYALRAFKLLLDTPNRLAVESDDPATAVCAGIDADSHRIGILAARLRGEPDELTLRLENRPWQGASRYEVFAVDAEHRLGPIASGRLAENESVVRQTIRPPAVYFIRLEKAE